MMSLDRNLLTRRNTRDLMIVLLTILKPLLISMILTHFLERKKRQKSLVVMKNSKSQS